jgi:hypothetical protein
MTGNLTLISHIHFLLFTYEIRAPESPQRRTVCTRKHHVHAIGPYLERIDPSSIELSRMNMLKDSFWLVTSLMG